MPAGTHVAHKSGTSDVDRGVAHATNDIGLTPLPDAANNFCRWKVALRNPCKALTPLQVLVADNA